MSYRHSSYRKLSKALVRGFEAKTVSGHPVFSRTEMDRVMHWSNRPGLPKLANWGRGA